MIPCRVPVFLLLVALCTLPRGSSGASVSRARSHQRPKVVVLSFDGFRWDYMDQFHAPYLKEVARGGVHARIGIKPAFVTKTFPNHYTLATGLYEESHGIIDNDMYDPEFDEIFNQTNKEYKWWAGGEPLWVTATRQNVTTAVLFWPGSEVHFPQNDNSRFQTLPYDKKMPFERRMDIVMEWLVRDHADLVMAYFHEPDSAGHRSGAGSHNVSIAIQKVDNTVGYLMRRLKEENLKDTTDVIILSDHGMTNHTDNYLIDLSKTFAEKGISDKVRLVIPKSGPVVGILPKANTAKGIQEVYEALQGVSNHVTVYLKQDIPDRYHYKNNRRVMPILLVADEGYIITQNEASYRNTTVGYHGYDNQLRSMRPIFLATGPDFKKDYEFSEDLENVNVYPLVCHLIHIQPAPNNGTVAAVRSLLKNSAARNLTDKTGLYLLMLQLLLSLFQ